MTTEAVTKKASTESASTTESTQATVQTTEAALRESARSLEQPEELTTLVQESVATTSEVPLTSSEGSISSAEIEKMITKVPATQPEAATTQVSATEVKVPATESNINIQEIFTSTEVPSTLPVTQEAKTDVPSSTQETKSDASPELAVSPTEFEKLLTTLREFVAKVDASTSTETPASIVAPEIPQLEQIVEYVNYTVSAEKEKLNEETKLISKRSVPDADLIPRYFKQHYSLNKEKGCIFNGRSFKLGEAIKTDNDCLKCLCEYAPIGHCMLKEKCNF